MLHSSLLEYCNKLQLKLEFKVLLRLLFIHWFCIKKLFVISLKIACCIIILKMKID